MKAGTKFMPVFPIIVWFLGFYLPSYAQDPALERIGDFGSIDWIGQKVVAKGIGVPPAKYYGQPQARPMAQRAAVTLARRNLLEVIEGVHIDATTRIKNSLVQDETIVVTIKSVLDSSAWRLEPRKRTS